MMRGFLWLFTAAAVTASSFLLYGGGQALFDPNPNLTWLDMFGDHADNYDMEYMNPDALDWPVGIIWRDYASLDGVRSYLSQKGYGPVEGIGADKYVRVWEDSEGGEVEWSNSKGNQTACFDGPDPEATSDGCQSGDRCMRHTRTYADNDYFSNDQWGHYILATAHYDTNHAGCGSGWERFGWSETVEQIIVNQADDDGFEVERNSHDIDMHNAGTGWMDDEQTHYHQSDGYASFISLDSDGDGVLDSVDNCPTVYNPDQANYDGRRRWNGSQIPGDWASNPTLDKMGNACDSDDDNDGLNDSSEYDASCPYRLVGDSDGDRSLDGYEVAKGKNPCSASSNPTCSSSPDSDGDRLLDCYERTGYNTCTVAGDTVPGWSTCANPKDSDGDGCSDMLEALDLNGDRFVDSGDQGLMSKRVAGKIPPSDSDPIFDVNKDRFIDSGDQGLMYTNNCAVRPTQLGCPECPSE